MNKLFVCTLLGFAVGVAIAKECGVKEPSATTDGYNRIVGGVDAYENEFPWQVSWRFFNVTTQTHRHICGASIIGDEWLLTAAHCVDVVKPLQEANFRAMVGAHSQSKPSANQRLIEIKKITIHPSWDSSQIINDVAVVQLSESLNLTYSPLNAICLGRPQDVTEDRNAVISGWGLLQAGASTIPDILQRATVKVEKQSTCRSIYSMVKPLSDGEVCAGRNPGGCNGDSGGPLQYEKDGKWFLLGAASWVVQCGSTTFPTVWARVPYFLNFITATSGISPPA